jgi:hypothetical protein
MITRAATAFVLVSALGLTGCTGSEPQEAAPTPSPTRTADPVPSPAPLTAGERAQQLTALRPEAFDATYRLVSKGPRPDARVRMRVDGDRFRLDVTQGRSTATLVYGSRGVVSCQIVQPKVGRADRSCFLVARTPKGLPDLFDPQVQRLFLGATRAISAGGPQLTVKRAGTWRAPRGLGPSECFVVKGKDVESGKYCYLSRPAPTIGLLARAVFPSGRLELREAKNLRGEGLFRPPVRPTPLPAQG